MKRNKMNLSNVYNWQDAVCKIVDDLLYNNKCFSSGEVAAILKSHRKDLSVPVPKIGLFLRDLYSMSALKYKNGQMAERVDRYTKSNNVLVFVYAPTQTDGQNHCFEIGNNKKTMAPQQKLNVVVSNVQNHFDLYATVQKDGRITIPKRAFKTYENKINTVLVPGHKVYVCHDPVHNTINVSYDVQTLKSNFNGTLTIKEYSITRDLGKIKYTPDNSMLPVSWKNGTKYEIVIPKNSNLLVVDLKKVVS